MRMRDIIISCILAARFSSVAASDEMPVSLEAIIGAWQARQNNTKTLEFQWTSTEFQAADSQFSLRFKGPPSDVSFQVQATYIIDARGRFRLDYFGRTYSAKDQAYVDAIIIDENDGSKRVSFFPKSSQEFPNAQIGADPNSKSANTIQTLPIRLVYRTIDAVFGVMDPSKAAVIKSSSIINGAECVGVRQAPSANSPLDVVIWVDPAKDFIPVQYWSQLHGKPLQYVEISSFIRDQVHGWVPDKWTVVRKFDKSGNPKWSDAVAMTKFSLNHHVPDSAFEIPFPVGTWVQDNITKTTYIVKDGGEHRPILPGEFDGTNYRYLLNSKLGDNLKPQSFRFYLIAVNLIVIAVVVYLIVRKRGATKALRS